MSAESSPRAERPDDLAILAAHQELTARDHVIGLEAQVVRLERDLERVRGRVQRLRDKVDRLEDELAAVRASRTWRVGRFVTGAFGRGRG